MSYDLSVWCVEPFRDPAALADAGAWKPDCNGWMLEGRGWLLHAGPSDAVLDEDLPDEVRGALPGMAHVVNLSLEPIGAPKAAYAAPRRTAKLVSRAARGAVFDPQAGTVDLPSGAKRCAAPPPGEARISLLELSWWFDHSDLLGRNAVERLFDVLALRSSRSAHPADPPEPWRSGMRANEASIVAEPRCRACDRSASTRHTQGRGTTPPNATVRVLRSAATMWTC